MASSTPSPSITFTSLFLIHFLSGWCSGTLVISNRCSYIVWPVISSSGGTIGFALQPGESNTVVVPPAWSGRIWGRTLCSEDATGKLSCVTGDCGSSTVECSSGNVAPPVTLVELTLNDTGGLDLYDVSLVKGFNLPVVEPQDLTCRMTGCVKDLNVVCPNELKVIRDGEDVACKKVCQTDPCLSSLFFKTQCPLARAYAYDHGSFTCASASAHYIITFCPTSPTRLLKPKNKRYPAPLALAVDNSGGGLVDNSRAHLYGSFTKVIVVVLALASASVCGFYVVCKLTIHCPLRPKANANANIDVENEIQSL